jgi:lysophospholipid acyltransferase 7
MTLVAFISGPYYTYHVFDDYFRLNYSKNVDCFAATLRRIKWVPLYVVLFLSASYIWPLQYATSDEFFNERSFLYRVWYVWPTFFIFRMRIYIGLMLSECACTMAGLGAYPTALSPRCGSGPSKDLNE